MNSNNPGQSTSRRNQAFHTLAALVQDAPGQPHSNQRLARVQNALVALNDPLLHQQWQGYYQNVLATQMRAREFAHRAANARQEGRPANIQQFERCRANVAAEKANEAARNLAQFEEYLIRRQQEAFAQLLEQQGAPAYHPQVGHQGVPRAEVNNNVPAQEQTVAQSLAALHYLREVDVRRADEQAKAILDALRDIPQLFAGLQNAVLAGQRVMLAGQREMLAGQREMANKMRQLQGQIDRGAGVAQAPVGVGAPAVGALGVGASAGPPAAGGGPMRHVVRAVPAATPAGRGRRGPPKQTVEHKGKVIGMGKAMDPITGNYNLFGCTADGCHYANENRTNILRHFKARHEK